VVYGVLFSAGVAAQGQAVEQASSSDSTLVLRVSAPLVVPDAVVSDMHNRLPVSGLSAKDFGREEDGKLQNVSYFAQDKVPPSIVFMIDLTQTVKPVRQSLASAAQKILSHLRDADEVAVAVFSTAGKVILLFTNVRAQVNAALEQASQMSSDEGTFLNQSIYQVTTELMSKASSGNRKAIIYLTDGTVNVPSEQEQHTEGQSTIGITLHTEEDAKRALFQTGATSNAVIEKSPLAMSFKLRVIHGLLTLCSPHL
jgi:VWFA-related protein